MTLTWQLRVNGLRIRYTLPLPYLLPTCRGPTLIAYMPFPRTLPTYAPNRTRCLPNSFKD